MDEVTERVLVEQPTAVMRHRLEVTDIEAWIGPTFAQVARVATDAGLGIAGPPFARYWKVPGTAATFEVEAGFPVDGPLPAEAHAEVQPSRLPGGPAAVTLHIGPYDAMSAVYERVEKWVTDHDVAPDGPPWECYLSEPTGDPDTWRTELVQPYRAV
jgi:effector-binding domain-containing protein